MPRQSSPILTVTMILCSVSALCALAMHVSSALCSMEEVHRHLTATPTANSESASSGTADGQLGIVGNWPPREGSFYPDLVLTDQNGDVVRLSEFAGKVILLELAAIPCAGCQAFAGGNDLGGFDGGPVQKDLGSIHQYAKRFAGVDLSDNEDIVFVQLLLYGRSMGSPSQQEVSGWARHFKMDRTQNQIVLRGVSSMQGEETYRMIPGFHLIDRNFVLKCDSSGHQPKRDLYRDLLPELGQICGNP